MSSENGEMENSGNGEMEEHLQSKPQVRSTGAKSHKLLIVIIALVVVLAAVGAAMFFLMNQQSSVVGAWHITKSETSDSHGSESSDADEYMVFNSDGTGYIYESGTKVNFTWKDLGNGVLELTFKDGDMSTTIRAKYSVQGDSITLSMHINGVDYILYGNKVNSVPSEGEGKISNWVIMVNGERSKTIRAETKPDGRALWSGEIEIKVYDQNNNPIPNVKVILDGCGIVEAGLTNIDGEVIFQVQNVTLPSGVQEDEILVTLQYGNQKKTDTITVIRGGDNTESVNSWEIYINENKTKVIKAETQSDGSAAWSGSVKIIVYDQNGNPIEGVQVTLSGCGVNKAAITNSSGVAVFYLSGVTLPSGVQQDDIQVTFEYNGQEKTDTITVIRT